MKASDPCAAAAREGESLHSRCTETGTGNASSSAVTGAGRQLEWRCEVRGLMQAGAVLAWRHRCEQLWAKTSSLWTGLAWGEVAKTRCRDIAIQPATARLQAPAGGCSFVHRVRSPIALCKRRGGTRTRSCCVTCARFCSGSSNVHCSSSAVRSRAFAAMNVASRRFAAGARHCPRPRRAPSQTPSQCSARRWVHAAAVAPAWRPSSALDE
jgi:hypothetical protein